MILNRKILLVLLLAGPTILDNQNQMSGIYSLIPELLFCVAMANGQIGIVTDDTPLKTKEIILNGVYDGSPENGISQLLEESRELRMLLNKQEIKSDNIELDTGHCNESYYHFYRSILF
jgi:hypothetical protein